MNRAGQLLGQHLIHHPVPLDAAFSGKSRRNESHAEMRLPFRPRTGMSGVQMGFVHHLEALGMKRSLELLLLCEI